MFFKTSLLDLIKVKSLSLTFNDFFNNSEKAQEFLIEKEKRNLPDITDIYVKCLGFINRHHKKGASLTQIFNYFKPQEIPYFFETYLELEVKCQEAVSSTQNGYSSDKVHHPLVYSPKKPKNATPFISYEDHENIFKLTVNFLSNKSLENSDKAYFLNSIVKTYNFSVDDYKAFAMELVKYNKEFLVYTLNSQKLYENYRHYFNCDYQYFLLNASPEFFKSAALPQELSPADSVLKDYRAYLTEQINAVILYSFNLKNNFLEDLIKSKPQFYYNFISEYFFDLGLVNKKMHSIEEKEKFIYLRNDDFFSKNKFVNELSIEKVNYILSLLNNCLDSFYIKNNLSQPKDKVALELKNHLALSLLKKTLAQNGGEPNCIFNDGELLIKNSLADIDSVVVMLAKHVLMIGYMWRDDLFCPSHYRAPLLQECFKSMNFKSLCELEDIIKYEKTDLNAQQKELCLISLEKHKMGKTLTPPSTNLTPGLEASKAKYKV